MSGFRLLPNGVFSLKARLDLIERSQSSLDLQYYLISNDETGRALLRALRDAARRGVRVRLLVDDLYTAESDALLNGLSSYPNVQIRLFNPFAAGRQSEPARILSSLGELGRINHRMHNKLMIADGAFAILGGRNVANEYFNLSDADNFVDDDLLVAGPLIAKIADTFDLYWNSDYVYTIQSLEPPSGLAQRAQAQFDSVTEPTPLGIANRPPARDVLGYEPIENELNQGHLKLIQAAGFVYADYPSKISQPGNKHLNSASADIVSIMHAARSRVLISAPYFIPGKGGMELIEEDRQRGVEINILTNSLSSNDSLLAYVGYARYRIALLRSGVELFELSSQPFKQLKGFGNFRSAGGGLHAKQVVVDDQTVIIGSVNLDPRSADLNTEIALVVVSHELAQQMQDVIERTEAEGAHRLKLAADGSLEWLPSSDPTGSALNPAPRAGLLERLAEFLLEPIAPEEEL